MATATATATGETTSTCTAETIRGKHLFHVSGYSNTKGLGVGNFIRSATFNVGGFDWAIRYYPDGEQQDCEDYISVFVELMSKNTEVRAFYALKLADQIVASRTMAPSVFKHPGLPSCGFAKLRKRSALEASACVQDDRLTILCVIAVVKDPASVPGIELPPFNMAEHMSMLMGEDTDVIFIVGEESLVAHRWALAMRSPVFRAELYGPMREKDALFITIDDMQPVVFRALLHYVYTDSLPTMIDNLNSSENKEMFLQLLEAADRYAMESLKLTCEDTLSKSLDVETVATTLALADQHHCEMLKEACVEFITLCDRMDDVVASEGYQDLKTSCPSLLVDVWEKRGRFRSTKTDAVEDVCTWIFCLLGFFVVANLEDFVRQF